MEATAHDYHSWIRVGVLLDGRRRYPPTSKMLAVEGFTKMKLNPKYSAWHRQDQLLASWIQSFLTESTLMLVVGLINTSREIWSALETSFASQSKAKIMQYKFQLQTTKKENLSMREYLGKIKTSCDLLASVGCRIPEEDQILYALGGLNKDYDSVMVAISARIDPWSMQEVSALLHTFESRLESSSSKSDNINSDGSLPSALLGSTFCTKKR